jgi:hypothetical protein
MPVKKKVWAPGYFAYLFLDFRRKLHLLGSSRTHSARSAMGGSTRTLAELPEAVAETRQKALHVRLQGGVPEGLLDVFLAFTSRCGTDHSPVPPRLVKAPERATVSPRERAAHSLGEGHSFSSDRPPEPEGIQQPSASW